MSEILSPAHQISKLKIEYTKPNFHLHAFETQIEDEKIFFQVIKMQDSMYLWIGNKNKPLLLNMAIAMQTKYDKLPVATKILGDEMDTCSNSLACKLSKKLNKVVYVSFNVEENKFIVPIIEKRINEEIKKCPEKF